MTFYDELREEGDAETQPLVRVERRDHSAVVTLDDPEKLNVLSTGMVRQLRAALEELVCDPATRTVVLTGADPGFSGGGDLRMMDKAPEALEAAGGSTDIWRWIRREFGGIVRLIVRSDTAFVAAINGPAAGVSLAWALNCDLAIASERARIVPAFGRLGLLPEVGTSWALTHRLGYQRAFAYYASGEILSAEQAHELGLVHEVVPHSELLSSADSWCERIAALPAHAVAMTKPLLRSASEASWETALTMEEFAEPNCFTTEAFQQSVRRLLASGT
jgi:2-(1,2-epoxy-1,2-dihydrophenyl)acetyl-CoA isomerase